MPEHIRVGYSRRKTVPQVCDSTAVVLPTAHWQLHTSLQQFMLCVGMQPLQDITLSLRQILSSKHFETQISQWYLPCNVKNCSNVPL